LPITANNYIVTFADAIKLTIDIAKKSWQTKRYLEVSGACTRQLILKVGMKLLTWWGRYWSIILSSFH